MTNFTPEQEALVRDHHARHQAEIARAFDMVRRVAGPHLAADVEVGYDPEPGTWWARAWLRGRAVSRRPVLVEGHPAAAEALGALSRRVALTVAGLNGGPRPVNGRRSR